MKSLRIGSTGGTDIDLACAGAGRFVLWRQNGQVQLTVPDQHVAAVRRALAFAGVSASPSDAGVPAPPRLLAAIGTGLAPARLGTTEALDLLEIRVVPLREATARLTRRRLALWPIVGRRRARCRALLRGTDALLEVRRSAWCDRATLRAARGSLRPLLFDRSTSAPALRVYAADGALSGWIDG